VILAGEPPTGPRPVHPALKRELDPFAAWCIDELFTSAMIRAEEITQLYCDAQLAALLRRFGMADLLHRPLAADEVSRALKLESTAPLAIQSMLHRLASRTPWVIEEPSAPVRFRGGEALPDTPADVADLWLEMRALGEDYLAALDFIQFGAVHFLHALRDDPEFMDRVLGGNDPRHADLWYRATNTDPLQDAHGRMGGRAARDLFHGGVVLEVGGGTGNGTKHLLRELVLAGRLSTIERYLFTDVSVRFVLTTRRSIERLFPALPCAWQFLDVNRPFAEQKIAAESVDLIYGVNSAHVAADVLSFLRECRVALRPGGRILFAERVRRHAGEMAPREITLNLSRYHRTAARRDPDYRPDHAYLSPAGWLRALERAGFEDAGILPDPKALAAPFPNAYAAVVTASRPR
jgi:SAM-dependent methyltransferase